MQLYKRGLPAEWRRQPVGAARGMAVHESQSLFLEMQVCRSRPFAQFAAPAVARDFRRLMGRPGNRERSIAVRLRSDAA